MTTQEPKLGPDGHVPLRVLVVEDDQDLREVVTYLVKGLGHEVSIAANGEEAIRRLHTDSPDIMVLDLMMPEMDGFAVCQFIQKDEAFRDLHVIITSAKDALEDKVRGLELGAADYITKPFSLAELKARLQVGERLVRYRKAVKEQQAKLERLAREDELTGLCNRRHFEERAQKEWSRAQRYRRPLSLLMGDLDHFKEVNDRYGHLSGDVVLRQIAQLLLQHCRGNDLVARYGGEEFAILLPEARPEEAQAVAERLCTEIRTFPFESPSGLLQMTISFGVTSLSDEQPQGLKELIGEADQALYAAKHKGKDQVARYGANQQEEVVSSQ